MSVVVGVDGTVPAGWVTVRLDEGRLDAIRLAPELADLLDVAEEASCVAVNLPWLHDDPTGERTGRRRCDAAARDALGPRGDAVVPAPSPVVLDAPDRAAARDRAEESGWPAPSETLWRVRDRVRSLRDDLRDDDRFVEVHPELAFQAILRRAGGEGHLDHPRDHRHGEYERLELLHDVGLRPTRSLGGIGRASPRDVLDASAAAWSAARVASGEARTVPEDPPDDPELGRPVAFRV